MSVVIFSTDLSATSLPNIDVLKSKMSAPIYEVFFQCFCLFKIMLFPCYNNKQIYLHFKLRVSSDHIESGQQFLLPMPICLQLNQAHTKSCCLFGQYVFTIFNIIGESKMNERLRSMTSYRMFGRSKVTQHDLIQHVVRRSCIVKKNQKKSQQTSNNNMIG